MTSYKGVQSVHSTHYSDKFLCPIFYYSTVFDLYYRRIWEFTLNCNCTEDKNRINCEHCSTLYSVHCKLERSFSKNTEHSSINQKLFIIWTTNFRFYIDGLLFAQFFFNLYESILVSKLSFLAKHCNVKVSKTAILPMKSFKFKLEINI